MNAYEVLLTATGVAVSGNIYQALALVKEKFKIKNDPELVNELVKLRKDLDDLLRINDALMLENFQLLRPELLNFIKSHSHIIPVSALDGFKPGDDQIKDWVVRNRDQLPIELRRSLLEWAKPEEHEWELMFKSKHGDTQNSVSKVPLTSFVEKCKKCSMIHRYHAPVAVRSDGFYFGEARVKDLGCRVGFV